MSRIFTCLRPDDDAPPGAIGCDGLVPGAALDLSHWRGNRTPLAFKADTSTEIALAFIDSEQAAELADAPVVNNHFDTDGLLSVWTLLHPDAARARRELIVSAAVAGDFAEWPEDPRGVWVDAAVRRLAADADDDAAAYASLLAQLPELLDTIDDRRDLWGPAQDAIDAARVAIDDGRLQVSLLGSIGIVRHAPEVAEIPATLLSYLLLPRCWRYLLVFEEEDGRANYRYELPAWCWADTVVRPVMEWPESDALLGILGESWTTEDLPGLTAIVRTKEPIDTQPKDVLRKVVTVDREAYAALP
ncbi:MAG: hypothetical protein CMJ83_06070 [Planctomycetes bacterium]|nr:hypothetical protein [Planctomycetota bacterium]